MIVRSERAPLLPYITAGLVSAALTVYAVLRSFVWDEGFHLVAAQLIQAGKRPYLDFCFPQTPLNAYWNAAWMSLFGDSWRVTHVAAALLLSATLFLTAGWSLEAFRWSRWRIACACINVLLLGCNITVFQFGPIAQAYAMCMFCSFSAFLLLARPQPVRIFLGGLLTGIGAASSLLIAPVAPVFLIAAARRIQHRWRNACLYLAGCVIPFAPVIWLFIQNPQNTFFNVVRYQALFRRVNWGNVNSHDADVLTSWTDNGSALLLALFFLAGAVWIARRWRDYPNLVLCLALALALILYISTAHPTFARYYIVGAPFYTAIATAGFLWIAERLFPASKPLWPAAGLAALLVLCVVRFISLDTDSTTWDQYEKVAAQVAKVTPHHSEVFADEQVYFLLHWTPPPGLEFSYSHKLSFPPAEEARLHIISQAELKKQTEGHRFAVLETCDDDLMDKWHLDNLYAHRQDFDDCAVFW